MENVIYLLDLEGPGIGFETKTFRTRAGAEKAMYRAIDTGVQTARVYKNSRCGEPITVYERGAQL